MKHQTTRFTPSLRETTIRRFAIRTQVMLKMCGTSASNKSQRRKHGEVAQGIFS